jgi:hypothetical protein
MIALNQTTASSCSSPLKTDAGTRTANAEGEATNSKFRCPAEDLPCAILLPGLAEVTNDLRKATEAIVEQAHFPGLQADMEMEAIRTTTQVGVSSVYASARSFRRFALSAPLPVYI